jgi:hypothetical protein
MNLVPSKAGPSCAFLITIVFFPLLAVHPMNEFQK